MKSKLLIVVVLLVVLYLATRTASSGAGDRSHLGPVSGGTLPYWDYNA